MKDEKSLPSSGDGGNDGSNKPDKSGDSGSGSGGGGGGGTPDEKSANEQIISGRKIRRRPRPGATAEDAEDEEESKAEIESLAGASEFTATDGKHPPTMARNENSSSRRAVQPGAYAVDGPDHGSQSSLFGGSAASADGVLGLGGTSDANPNGNITSGGGNNNDGDAGRRRGSAQSVQSGQSENSAVAEVRAALQAEREAARAAGMGTRRPSMRSSVTSGVGSSSAAASNGIGAATTDDPSGGHRRTSSITMSMSAATNAHRSSLGGTGIGTNTGSGDLANHPDIEFLAEATLVVDSVHDDDDPDEGEDAAEKQNNVDDDNGDDPPPDYDEALADDDGDVSTLGPPPELSLAASRQRSAGGTRGRQCRSARPTDPYADVPEATCTSVDESHHRHDPSRTGTRSQAVASSASQVDGGGRPEMSPMEMEEGTGASPSGDSDILVAEPLKDKCLLPRRTVVIGLVVGIALMLAIALGVAIPLSKRDDGATTLPPDGGGNATYPAFRFNPPNSEVLTTVPEPICFSLLPVMTNVSQVCTDPIVDLPKGGPMDQLIADGLLSASDPAANIDIALINGGAFRSDLFAGDLTAGFVRKMVMPFTNNRVAYLSVTPAEIYDTLNGALFDTGFVISEEQQRQFFPESPTVKLTWPYESTYPYAAGLRYDVDLNAAEGQKATNVRIHSSSSYRENDGGGETPDDEDGWVLLDPNDTTTLIRVLSSDYLAGGGDGFFQTVPEERVEILDGLGITQLFMYYCSLQTELVGPHYIDEMSTREFVPLEGYENDL